MARLLVEKDGERRIVDGVDYRLALRPLGWKVVGVDTDTKAPLTGGAGLSPAMVDPMANRKDAEDAITKAEAGPGPDAEVLADSETAPEESAPSLEATLEVPVEVVDTPEPSPEAPTAVPAFVEAEPVAPAAPAKKKAGRPPKVAP